MFLVDKTAETVLLSKIEIELKLVKQQKNLLSRLLIMKCEQNLDVDYQEIIDTNFKCSICFEIFVKVIIIFAIKTLFYITCLCI